MATFWSTKYILTQGILREDDCEVTECGKYASRNAGRANHFFQRIGTDAHPTEEEAKAAGQKIVAKAIQSLDKKRLKLLRLQESLTLGGFFGVYKM